MLGEIHNPLREACRRIVREKFIKLTIIGTCGVCSMNLVGDGINPTNAHKHTKRVKRSQWNQ